MESDNEEMSRIAERIVTHPTFLNRLTQMTQAPSPFRRSFSSPREETENLFFRGRRQQARSTSNTPRLTSDRSRSRNQRRCQKQDITVKEVVLLDNPSQEYTVRDGEKKAFLTENGIVFKHLFIIICMRKFQVGPIHL